MLGAKAPPASATATGREMAVRGPKVLLSPRHKAAGYHGPRQNPAYRPRPAAIAPRGEPLRGVRPFWGACGISTRRSGEREGGRGRRIPFVRKPSQRR